MMYRCLEPEFCHEDVRGSLVQLMSENCAQINILRTHAGVVRGGHYHKRCTETFYVISGSVHVEFSNEQESKEKTFYANDLFAVLPGTAHTAIP